MPSFAPSALARQRSPRTQEMQVRGHAEGVGAEGGGRGLPILRRQQPRIPPGLRQPLAMGLDLSCHGQWWCLPAHHDVRRAAARPLSCRSTDSGGASQPTTRSAALPSATWRRGLPSWPPRLRRLHGMSCRRLLEPHLDHRASLTFQELATRNSARLHEKQPPTAHYITQQRQHCQQRHYSPLEWSMHLP